MTTRFDLLERFLSYLFHPLASFARGLWHSPTDTVVDAAVAAGEFVQEHPLTCVAIVGAGMYAKQKGWLKLERWGGAFKVEADTSLGGFHSHNSAWIGKRKVL